MNKVLIIDDDKELCTLIKRSVLSENIEADICNTGKEGLKKLKEKEAECVRPGDIFAFLKSPLGQRMKKASEKRLLFREQPFVISRKAEELNPDWEGERILVQGIMDAYFMEEGELILVDYKTDRMRKGEEQVLTERYRNQILDYGEALSRAAGKPVKEAYIYSFGLGKEIEVE